MMAIRSSVMQDLLKSPYWTLMLEDAETNEQIAAVLEAFCRSKGKEIVYLPHRSS